MSLFIGLFGVFLNDWNVVMERGFFSGYSALVAAVVLLQVHTHTLTLVCMVSMVMIYYYD